jgi:predicted RNA binding protein YcfA (HicA-like mRNA interferase family)
MRIPRDISGSELVKKLRSFGYTIDHQTGSHMRLVTVKNGLHTITIPMHKNLRLGTLSSILMEVSNHFNLSKDEMSM